MGHGPIATGKFRGLLIIEYIHNETNTYTYSTPYATLVKWYTPRGCHLQIKGGDGFKLPEKSFVQRTDFGVWRFGSKLVARTF
jgi:hypothetical protein